MKKVIVMSLLLVMTLLAGYSYAATASCCQKAASCCGAKAACCLKK